jgi:hypothetical protein
MMKRVFFVPLALLLLESMTLAQATPPAAPAQTLNKIAAGTVISAVLSKGVDAKKVKVGDKVEAKTNLDLLSNGQVMIPKGSKISGSVTDAKARSKDSKDSTLGIAFDHISIKDGSELPIQAAIQAIGRPIESASNNSMSAAGPIGSSGSSMPSAASGQGSDPSAGAPLSANSQGVVGIRGLSLSSSGPASVLSSSKENVHLDGGTQLILRIQ